MKLITNKISFYFGSLHAQFRLNKVRDAVRFEAQNKIWNHEQLEIHSNAAAKGFISLGLKKGDTILLRVPEHQQSETVVTQIGSGKVGLTTIISQSQTQSQLQQQLLVTKAAALIFDPNVNFHNNIKLIEALNNIFPQLQQSKNGSVFRSESHKTLRHLIQTGFYSYFGIHKYRNVLNYASDDLLPTPDQNADPIALPKSNNPLIISQTASGLGYQAGLLNSVINGRYVIYAGKNDLGRLVSGIPNAEIIAQHELNTPLPESVTLITRKGLNVWHSRRIEI